MTSRPSRNIFTIGMPISFSWVARPIIAGLWDLIRSRSPSFIVASFIKNTAILPVNFWDAFGFVSSSHLFQACNPSQNS